MIFLLPGVDLDLSVWGLSHAPPDTLGVGVWALGWVGRFAAVSSHSTRKAGFSGALSCGYQERSCLFRSFPLPRTPPPLPPTLSPSPSPPHPSPLPPLPSPFPPLPPPFPPLRKKKSGAGPGAGAASETGEGHEGGAERPERPEASERREERRRKARRFPMGLEPLYREFLWVSFKVCFRLSGVGQNSTTICTAGLVLSIYQGHLGHTFLTHSQMA